MCLYSRHIWGGMAGIMIVKFWETLYLTFGFVLCLFSTLLHKNKKWAAYSVIPFQKEKYIAVVHALIEISKDTVCFQEIHRSR